MPGAMQEGSREAVGFMMNREEGMVSSADAVEQLTSVFEVYSAATNRMQQAYDQLQQDVIRLRQELAQKNAQLERKNRLAALGEMDQVAYVRFASVYRSFQDVAAFREEVERLENELSPEAKRHQIPLLPKE